MSDCISRQAVLEQLNCWIGSGEYRYAMSERFLIDRIKTLPPVNPQEPTDIWSIKDVADTFKKHGLIVEQEPKTGHWKKIQSGDKDFPESIVCSRCGHENSYLDFGISSVPIGKSFKKSKFCPNCGAKMEGE